MLMKCLRSIDGGAVRDGWIWHFTHFSLLQELVGSSSAKSLAGACCFELSIQGCLWLGHEELYLNIWIGIDHKALSRILTIDHFFFYGNSESDGSLIQDASSYSWYPQSLIEKYELE